jgi:hypothetical protein
MKEFCIKLVIEITQHPSFQLFLYSDHFHLQLLRHLHLRQLPFFLLLTLNTSCPLFYLYSIRTSSFIMPFFNILFVIFIIDYAELRHPYSQFCFEHLHCLLHYLIHHYRFYHGLQYFKYFISSLLPCLLAFLINVPSF